jgi:hypothetical protein
VTLDRPGGGRRARGFTRSWHDTREKENEPIAGTRVEGISGQDWKLQSRMKGCDLKAAWLIVVATNSI